MICSPVNTTYSAYKVIGLFIFFAITHVNGYAQSVEPLPDSVKATEDTIAHSNATESDSPKINIVMPDTVVLRSVPDSAINAFKRDKDFAYANDAAYWAKEPVGDNNYKDFWYYFWSFITSRGVRIFVYLLIAAVLIFAFYKIVVENKLYLFYSPPKKLAAIESNETDINNEDLEEKIHEAFQVMDYRLAIRYMHLKALRRLDEKGFIHFHSQGTSHEYAVQLSAHKQGKDFRYLTDVYEYVWYGGFTLTQQQAETLQKNFNRFYISIES